LMSPSTHPHPTHPPNTGTITPSPHTHIPAASHQHQHQQLEAANRAHFDAHSETYDTAHPHAYVLSLSLSQALRRLVPLNEDTTCVLDYACGSGQVSRALAPYVGRLVGVDISPRMVELYNARADAQGLEPHEMRAVCALSELDAQDRFDLIVCSMAYHHFAAVDEVSRELVKYLKPGGTLAVADIADTGQHSDGGAPPHLMAGYEHIVAHTHGFSEEDIRALFVGTGLENISFELFTSAKRQGRDVYFFLATGTRATTVA